MQRLRSLLALATFLLISAPALAQQSSEIRLPQPTVHKPIRFEALTQADGIRQTTVTQILQDRDGFLWFAHEAGVDRYDGYKLTSYSSEPFDTTSLQQGVVWSMIETGDGSIWMGTANGAARYNRETDSFERFKIVEEDLSGFLDGSVMAIEEDKEGQLWFGTFNHGLRRMDPDRKGEIEILRHDAADPTTISHDLVVSVHEDPSGRIWVGTWDGLNLKEPGKGGR
ncbi:MAG: two-component regulator propeller domain-containing protein, partial [Rhodothermales bacterium]